MLDPCVRWKVSEALMHDVPLRVVFLDFDGVIVTHESVQTRHHVFHCESLDQTSPDGGLQSTHVEKSIKLLLGETPVKQCGTCKWYCSEYGLGIDCHAPWPLGWVRMSVPQRDTDASSCKCWSFRDETKKINP